ncbi:hypothetical protein BH09PLA1_BH09PLA1_15380 [soil metagenome]
MIRRALTGIAAVIVCASSVASAQLRMGTYNIQADIDGFTTPRPGLDTVLQAIGNESVNGIVRGLDILTLQETTNNATTVAPIVNSLNNFYGAGTYAQSPYQGTQSGTSAFGNGPNAVVYNTNTVQLIASVGIFTPSSSGPPRQELRYQFRPVGYGSNADFYVYVGHYKSASDSTSENRRNIEAQLVRANAATLPAGSRVIYTGDLNLFKGSSEPAWQTLLAPGEGQAIDPINLGNGTWVGSSSTYRGAYTASTTSLAFRDDIQLQTGPTMDGHGFSYITGSHHTFGNNGSTPLNAPATSGSNTALAGMPNRSAILSALTTASDHYPAIADYRLPAMMSVGVGAFPSQVITGANVVVNVSVANSAPVLVSSGADGLDYALTASGSLSGSGNGVQLPALTSANVHPLSFNTSTVGLKTGTISVNSTSQEVANGSFSQAVSVQVIDHSQPSLSNIAGTSVATIDFAIHGRGLGNATSSFSIFNLVGNGATAGLDLDSINGSGSTAALTTNAAPFTNLPAGANSSNGFVASINSNSNGTFSATYTFNLSDQDLPGAIARGPLMLVLKGIIATPGDADLNGSINFDDYSHIDNGFNNGLSGWGNGDFDGNGVINFDDYALIDLNFNMQGRSLLRAMSYLDGSDRSDVGMDLPALALVENHLAQFGEAYAGSFLNAVPEPGAALPIVGFVLSFAYRIRRPRMA